MKKLIISLQFCILPLLFYAQINQLDSLIDNWHLSASKSDYKSYSDFMADNFVFLGTDPTERWDKNSFLTFCKPYFDQGKGWDFSKIERHISFSRNGKVAWFDETVNTWMNVCRGSGVLVKKRKSWKIAQYNLAVLIENDKMNDFLKLRNQ